MLIYVQYDTNTGAIEAIADFELDNSIQLEESDDFNPSDLYGYKIQDEQLVSITEEEKKELYPFLFESEQDKQNQLMQQMMIDAQKEAFLVNLSDDQAKDIPLCFTSWSDYADGYSFKVGDRVEYNSGLWKCNQAHAKQVDWYPSASPTLWIQLDKDEHKGTKDDPIPVPESASTSGFEYTKGLYYSESDKLYLMNRQGMADGETITLYYLPSALVGHYFELVQ